MKKTDAVSVHDSKIIKQLTELGIIPPQCRKWELIGEANHVLIMRSEVFVTSLQMETIIQVLNDYPEERQAIAETVFKVIGQTEDEVNFVGEEWLRHTWPRKVQQEG